VGKLNEQTKNYLRIGIVIVCVAIIIFAGWFLLRDIHDNGTTADNVREQLDAVAREQQSAEKSLESVQSGIADSERTVGELEQSASAAQSTADRIAESNSNIKTAVDSAQRANDSSTELINDSESRISECQSILQAVRARAGTDSE